MKSTQENKAIPRTGCNLRAREPGTFRARWFPRGALGRAPVFARRDRSLLDRFGRAPRMGLALLALFGLLMPAAVGAPTPSPAAPTPVPATAPAAGQAPAAAPNVVDVSVTGNTHVPTDRILAVVRTKVGEPFDPAIVSDDLRAINDLGYFADQAPPVIKQRPDGVSVTFRVVENPVVTSIRFQGNRAVSSDTIAGAHGHRDRQRLQPQDLPARRAENQFVLRQDRLRRSGPLARHRREHRHERRAHADDSRRPDGSAHHHRAAAGRRSGVAVATDHASARDEGRQSVLRGAARQGRRETQGPLQAVRSHDRRLRGGHRSGDRRYEGRHGRRALRDFGRARRCDRDHRQHHDARRRDPPRTAPQARHAGHRFGRAQRLQPAQQPRLLRKGRRVVESRPRSEEAGLRHLEVDGQGAAHRYGPNRRRLLRRSDRHRAHRQPLVLAEQHQRYRKRRLDPVRKRHRRSATRSSRSACRTSATPKPRTGTASA